MTPSPLRVELFVRSLAPNGFRQAEESAVERLQQLEATSVLDGLSVYVTGDQICPDAVTASTQPGGFLLDRIGAVHRWADRTDRTIYPFFQRVEEARGIDDSDCSGIRFPAMVLAEYDGDQLRFVAPSADGTATETIHDRLDELEQLAGDDGATGAGAEIDTPID
jgi:hypothetical protein